MFLDRKGLRVFIYREAIDMRCGFERLHSYCVYKMQAIIDQGHVYVFFGKNRRRMKLLVYDGSGLVMIAKRDEAQIPHAYCWAHARREFKPLEDHDPSVKLILDLMDKIFAVERKAKSLDELGSLRTAESTLLIEQLKKELYNEYPQSRARSQKRKAIEYSLKRWSGLTMFLTDTRIPLSNNEAERTIRHAVMGRKNFYGSRNQRGAETAATLYTIIESCKKNEIDPRTFLLMSLERAVHGEELETPLG